MKIPCLDSTIKSEIAPDMLPCRLWVRRAGDDEVEFMICTDNTSMPSSAISVRVRPDEAIAFLRECISHVEKP